MVYRLNTGVEYPIKRQIKAAALALIVTVGVPALASLVHNYTEIFPGPSIVRSNESVPRIDAGWVAAVSPPASGGTGQTSSAESNNRMPTASRPAIAVHPSPTPAPAPLPVGGFGGGDSSSTLPSTEQPKEDETSIPPVEDDPGNTDIQIQAGLAVGDYEAETTLSIESNPPEADAELGVE